MLRTYISIRENTIRRASILFTPPPYSPLSIEQYLEGKKYHVHGAVLGSLNQIFLPLEALQSNSIYLSSPGEAPSSKLRLILETNIPWGWSEKDACSPYYKSASREYALGEIWLGKTTYQGEWLQEMKFTQDIECPRHSFGQPLTLDILGTVKLRQI